MASSAVVWGVLALGFWGFRGGPYQLRTKRFPFFLFFSFSFLYFLQCFLFMEIYLSSFFLFFLKIIFVFFL